MKKIFVVAFVLLLGFALTGCEENKTHHAEIVVKDMGTIAVELDGRTAPISVNNFIKLAKSGFYDGTTFHRIIENFMIQGGAPNTDIKASSLKTIKGEFSANGVNNTISHKRGVISMARATNYNSGSSQFFIMHKDTLSLDGQYAAFGHVTSGMEIVDEIATKTPTEDSNGTVLEENRPIIETVKVIN